MSGSSFTPIAVVGLGALLPGANDVDGFWRRVLGGADLITDVPESHWLVEDYYDADPKAPDKTYGRRGAFLDPVDFDPLAFGIPPNQLAATDTTQLLSLMVADQVLKDAGRGSDIDRDRVSVILGTAPLELLATMASRLQRPVWLKALRESGIPEDAAQSVCDRIADHYVPWQEASFPGLLSNVVAGRIANRFDLHGTNCTTDAACASSLAALSAGVNELALGQADLVVTGGVDTLNDITMYMCFSKTPALSPSGDCKPFSDAADGTILGEGLVMFALKRLADAERDGDHVYAVLKGMGTASDGRSTAIYAPLAEGQARALRRAYESAGYGPETVELVEAHGTGTTAGDVAEFTALRTVFSETGRADSQWCALGSVKSQIGHTKSAAGAAGMLKAVLALNHKVLPPTIKVDRPNPALELESSPLYLNTQARPWIRDSRHPRRASVSSFGFGGSNFHLTLEEYVPGNGAGRPAWRSHSAPVELVLLSAATPAELLTHASQVDLSRPLADIARETQSSFVATDAARLSVVASSTVDLSEKLAAAAALIGAAPERSFSTPGGTTYGMGTPVTGRVGFLFSGQGSQYVGMGADLAMEFPAARAVWDGFAGTALGERPLHTVVFPVPAFTDSDRAAQQAALTATEWAQPALAVQSLAQLALLDALKISPEAVAGHSFGELVALHTAGAFDAETLVRLARRRGEAMRDAASVPGAMLAVTADPEQVAHTLSDVDGAWVANHNSPDQVVVSGTVTGIVAAERRFAAAGLSVKRLDTATGFHSPLVAPAVDALRTHLADVAIESPRIDVFGNTDAAVYPTASDIIRTRVAEHLAAPVRFVDEIEAMYAAGVRTFVEVGAGSTLTALVGRILGDRPHLAVSLDRRGRHGVTALYEALGKLSAYGVAAEFDALWSFYAPPADCAETTKPRMVTKLSGANFGKPYPPAGGAAALPAPVVSAPAPAIAAEPEPVASVVDDTPGLADESPLESLVLGVVAEKTGYPVEMLEGSMELEADLGIDSIKRVEILSAVRRAVPGLPEVDPVELGKLRSLGEIVARLRAADGPAVVAPDPVAPQATAASAAASPELESLVLGVVAEKTGYPVEMLEGSMELEADLGIDSIKRVEILSAVRRVAPDLPEVDPVELGKLRSLGEIIAHLHPAAGPTVAGPAADGPGVACPAVAVPAQPEPETVAGPDLEQLVLDIVAEKTGYPAQMLDGSMELEADLGVDSVKRVHILAALRTVVPTLTESDLVELARLRSLDEIVARLGADHQPVVVAPPVAVDTDLESLVLGVVAEKTGYPVEMLEGSMELEADLGIDSIKRVEILSAVRRVAPDLPEVDPVELGKLRSLGEITARLRGAAPNGHRESERPDKTAEPTDSGLGRHAVRAVPAAEPGFALPGLRGGTLVVTDDGHGTARHLVARLKAVGIDAKVHCGDLSGAYGVIHLGGLADVASIDDALAVQRDAFAVAREIAPRMAERGGVFVTVQDTGGDFGVGGRRPARAWLGGIAGLTRTAAREWPAAAVKAIDCERGGLTSAAIADVIVRELLRGGSTSDIGLRANGTRTAVTTVAAKTESWSTRVTGESVIVATGGARGVTAEALVELARQHRPRLVLLGRTALDPEPGYLTGVTDEASLKRLVVEQAVKETGKPPLPARVNAEIGRVLAAREIRATLDRIRQAGSEVRYEAVDVRDGEMLAKMLDGVRREWGPITGVVHGAGVLADKTIADKTDEQFATVFDTKVAGLRAVLDATEDDPLDVLVVFSSISAHVGNPGQCDYAMANEVLNQVARAQRAARPGLVVRSIAWGPWDGGMVGPSLAEHFHRQGVPLIPVAAGARAFVAELASGGDTHVVIAAGDVVGPIDGGTGGRSMGEIQVDRQSHPYLVDHDIDGTPVLPMALVLEWFASAAKASLPVPTVLKDVSVLRKVSLRRYHEGGDRLTVQGSGEGQLELLGDGGVRHYHAKIAPGTSQPRQCLVPDDLRPARSDVYDGTVLFHGPQFQGIREMLGVSRSGAAAVLAGARELGWPAVNWHTDPAAVDGGLQLALLWAEQALGRASLPMGVGEVRTHRAGLCEGRTRCVVQAREIRADEAECDITFLGEDGSVNVELLGVRLVARPA